MPTANSLLEIWDTYNKNILLEKKTAPKMNKKPGPGARDLNDKANQKVEKGSGPDAVEGVQKPDDPKTNKKSPNAKFSMSTEKVDLEIGKKSKEIINNNMKSIFDKLYEDVMGDSELQDAQDLGVDVTAGDEAVDTEGVEEETVTVTLTKAQVDTLKEILAQLDGGVADEEVVDDVEGLDDEVVEDEESEFDFTVGEAVDAEEAGTPIKDDKKLEKGLTGVKNNEVGNLKAAKGKADAKVTDKVGSDGNLADSKGQALTKPGQQKVASKVNKPGADAFSV